MIPVAIDLVSCIEVLKIHSVIQTISVSVCWLTISGSKFGVLLLLPSIVISEVG